MIDELLLTVLLTSVPLILAATGELVAEKSGVLNLGVEGIMLMGAVAAFGAASVTGSPYLGIFGGGLAGMATAAVFALFALGLATNQVAKGLTLTIFGTGLSGLVGAPLVGQANWRVAVFDDPCSGPDSGSGCCFSAGFDGLWLYWFCCADGVVFIVNTCGAYFAVCGRQS